MHRVSRTESLRLLLRENAPTLEGVTPELVESMEASTGICKVAIHAYVERVRRKVPFALREAYLSHPRRRRSSGKTPEERRRDSTDGSMHFDVDPAESIHWNFPVPLTDGTGDMTLRNMSIIVNVAHELMQFQFDADIRIQVDTPRRLRKDSRCIDTRVDAEVQTESQSTACAAVQTDSQDGPPRFAACFNGRVQSHSSCNSLDPVHVAVRPNPESYCCMLQ